MNASPERAKSVFLAAAELSSPEARRALLDAECAHDEALRLEVEELLRHQQSLGNFLEAPAASLLGARQEDLASVEGAGAAVGRFKLLQAIGEGGMGVVFMAEQTAPIQRTVALKILKPGMDSQQVIARFEAERQALALMDHPNIARVVDAGTTPTGRPYFVMDLVKGVPITDYCDQQRLSIRQRLELMTAVCHAVQHAHQKGVIHRDLKPTNVLVAEYDGAPVPKVIDFGVAKAVSQRLTERTLFTEYGQLIGTLAYMSPEQARFNQLDVDTRSDIYSLGVLLYELLTGGTPLAAPCETAPLDETLRLIREVDPLKPSTRLSSAANLPAIAASRRTEPTRLSQEVRGELDWIVMRALEKDRNRRYPTANALALDLQRHLNDEPVEARPPTRAYRMAKFVRRHRAGMFAGGLAVLFLLGAVVVLLSSNARIRREAEVRELALTTAREAVDRMLTQVASKRFQDMPLSHPLRIALMEDARAFYERLSALSDDDPRLRAKTAELLHVHAGLLREVGDYDRAVAALRQSRNAWQSLVQGDPLPPTVLERLARVESDLAFTLHRGDESRLAVDGQAEMQYRRALAVHEELERRWPGRCEPELLSRRMLAKLAWQRGDRAAALGFWRAALTAGEAYLRRHPDHVDTSVEAGWTAVHLYDGLAATSSAATEELEATLNRGLAAVESALAAEPQSTRAVDVRASLTIRLASLTCRQGGVDDAQPLFEQAVADMERLCQGSPWTEDYWNSLRWFHEETATTLAAAGRPEAARDALYKFCDWLRAAALNSDAAQGHVDQIKQSQSLAVELLQRLESEEGADRRRSLVEASAAPPREGSSSEGKDE